MAALTRGASAALIAEFGRQGWHPAELVYVDWPSGAGRAHTGAGTISFGGHDWRGIGPYGRVEVPAESQSGAARRTVLTVLGTAATLLAHSTEQARGLDGEIWLGAVTEPAGNVLVADPVRIWRGTVDAIAFRVARADEAAGLSVTHALQLSLVSGPPLRRKASQYHTQEDQAANGYPADTIGRLIQAAEAEAQTLTWPE